METRLNFVELMMLAVGGFFIFVLLFAKFAEVYDTRQAAKKKNRPTPKIR